jgi:hypothetical protein
MWAVKTDQNQRGVLMLERLDIIGIAELQSFIGTPLSNHIVKKILIATQTKGAILRVTTAVGESVLFEILDPEKHMAYVARCKKSKKAQIHRGIHTVDPVFEIGEIIGYANGIQYGSTGRAIKIERLDQVIN